MAASDLAAKVSLLIGDFWAAEALAGAIEHEFEKRIVARSGLLKLDSLLQLARQYKNQIRDGLAPPQKVKTRQLEQLLGRLAKDHADAIGKARDVLSAHQLLLTFGDFGEQWLFMNSDTFGVLRLDLEEIDRELQSLDARYPPAWRPSSIPSTWPDTWITVLGPANDTRMLCDFSGFWNPGTVGFIFGHSGFQDHNALASGLSTRLCQTINLASPMVESGPENSYRRLLAELLVADLCSLEEILYTGKRNNYGVSMPPLSNVWKDGNHAGTSDLLAARAYLPANMATIRSHLRNQIACHVDSSILAVDLELSRWPVDLRRLESEVLVFLRHLYLASRKDIRTSVFYSPSRPLKNVDQLAYKREMMSWNTGSSNQEITPPQPPTNPETAGGPGE